MPIPEKITAHTALKTWQERRERHRIIAEFERLYPELKAQFTEYGKLKYMATRKCLKSSAP